MNKGEILFCPSCKKDLWKAKTDIFINQAVTPELFDAVNDEIKIPSIGEAAICFYCSGPLIFQNCYTRKEERKSE